MPKALVLLNPHARSAQNQLEAVRRRLNRAPSEVLGEISPHRKLSDFRVLLDRFKDQMDFIIVGGGDGTLSQVVRLMKELQIDCPLGVLPMGTANTFAQNLNLPQAWEECVAIIEAGVTRSVDLASVNGV